MKLRTQRRGSTNAAAVTGFAAGAACALLLLVGHQQHSEAHARAGSNRSLPGDLPDNTITGLTRPTSATAADQQTGTSAHTAQKQQQESAAEDVQHTRQEQAAAKQQQSMQVQEQESAAGPAPLPDLDSIPHLFVSFGNAAYFELAHNWAKGIQETGSPFLIAAFDDKLMQLCAVHSLPCTRIDLGGVDANNFRGDFHAFRAMGAVKVEFVAKLLEQHPKLPLVMVTDTDTVWLREPWTYFEQRPQAEFFISTDCLSMRVEDEWKEHNDEPRCGHIPGNGYGRAFNTGMFAARNTLAARAILRGWADMLTDPKHEHHTDAGHQGVDDQMALNVLADEGEIVGVGPDDPRAILIFNRTLRTQALPVSLFTNGHVAFVQRTPWLCGISPIVIHVTFQRWAGAGKKARLREFGLWRMDPPAYYGATDSSGTLEAGSSAGIMAGSAAVAAMEAGGGPGGARFALRLLTYANDVRQFVELQERERYGGSGHGMPLMEKNWVGMSYQLQMLRDALAAGRMLNRTVALPEMWCWCDFDEHPLVLDSCRIRGTDLELPFLCPLDFLLPVGQLDQAGMPYRLAGFLSHPQVPTKLRKSRSVIQITEGRPGSPYPMAAHTRGHGATVWQGILEAELLRAVLPVDHAAVLALKGRVPGFLGGFQERAAAETFDRQFTEAVMDWGLTPFWCCLTWGDADNEHRKLLYAMPPPLADGWKPWQAPQLKLPSWCDHVSTKYGNRDFMLLPQHPCNFLRNSTAAALAAAGAAGGIHLPV